ncbi:UDP-N-acetylmuramoyl-tripeptide--D-alanyl-D-alanine ligase [Nitrosomonas sp. Nm84]|uniref:UDP-N-acetylmuramoyl-tripeptide--D-alanyl-D- alanine ligase n=1 Tax=Nitrosomonas sp. Nm84 TaxID=200124 RepID=UPI000D7660CD|nr:UDP-N-acetylmuramoyl-tripeptide--D-alanyl-D-alanine ligase [Nitrosomonas sp. Nm84]PXW85225.1 UDP-N-acetylmuramoyl-tripeptide--D-alanyl-D-alanine ligase [Nitrosomonas sp. Nm84]
MMMAQEAAQVLHAEWNGKDALFTGVSTDSRTLRQGSLFIALTGENFDGSRFVGSAVEKGAVAIMINQVADNHDLPVNIPLLRVNDTRLGLGQLAAYWRSRFILPIVGVTGSNGKTTVKEMIAAILRQVAVHDAFKENGVFDQVLATEGNLNNDIGVPQMLLRLRQHHRYAVIEMGMNHIGEISYLTQLAKPTVALITNAGAAHIEGLGSVEAVARAKAEVFEGMDQQGVAVINADDAYAPLWRECAGSRQIMDFGLRERARINAKYQMHSLMSRIQLKLPDGITEVKLQVPGVHNIYNALAAAAAAAALGIKKELIATGLENFQGVQGRMQKKSGLHHARLIDDTYNANPESVRAALAVLAATEGKRILVLGDMGELGTAAIDLHRTIGRDARKAGLDQLLTLGELSAYAAEEFGKGAQHFNTLDELLNVAEHLLADDVTLLIKGSRFMQMERVVRQLEA